MTREILNEVNLYCKIYLSDFMTNEQADKLREDILNDNKMLYCMYKHPMTETCMCWGLEVPNVWLNEIDSLSKKLEGMNAMAYHTHRVRIQADQVKDKFAQLRFYYSIIIDPPAWICAYENAVEWLMRKLNKLNFKYVTVVDKEPYDEVIETDIPAGKVESEKKSYENCSNVDIIERDDGTYVKRCTYHRCRQTHQEPTKHKLLHRLLSNRYSIKNFIRCLFRWKPTYKQQCISEVMDSYAFKTIIDAEEKCIHICEHCGRHIGEKWSPTCQTLGWISYLCEECAEKNENGQYLKNGELWSGKTRLKTREEVEEDRRKHEVSAEQAR